LGPIGGDGREVVVALRVCPEGRGRWRGEGRGRERLRANGSRGYLSIRENR